MTKEEQKDLLMKIVKILKGIDKDGLEDPEGWWETSEGAHFGNLKLKEIKKLIESQREEDKIFRCPKGYPSCIKCGNC